MAQRQYGDVTVELGDDYVATVEMHRPPNTFFDTALIRALADAYADLDREPDCRAIVLCAEGKHFCAGANLSEKLQQSDRGEAAEHGDTLYPEALRVVSAATPVVAAVNGGAIGGGLGLACTADFRIGAPTTTMAAVFAQLGFHHGFGLTATLPPLVGQQRALELLMTGRRIDGTEAHRIGLLDRLVAPEELRAEAHRLAAEIAAAAPLAVVSIRQTMRADIAERFRAATERELAEQARLRATEDYREGVTASRARRKPQFFGR
jgi:enoyl-CoA hydratase/carnithine racemase